MNYFKKPGLYIAAASLAVALLAFQNCSKTTFSSTPDMSLKTEDMVQGVPDDSSPPDVVQPTDTVGDDDVVPAVSPTPVADATPVVSPSPSVPPYSSPTPVASGPGNSGGKDKENPSVPPGGSKPPKAVSAANAVECDLNRPNSKVVFATSLGVGSNAKASRICMSEHACLNIVNAYASARSCSLVDGAATSEPSGQCTSIFPGSRGTCKQAQILSDEQVSDLLAKMGAVK